MRPILALVLSIAAITTPAIAQTEYLRNGGFETGDLTGWTATSTSGGFMLNDGTYVPPGPGTALAPIGGSYDLVSTASSTAVGISQSFLVPTGITAATLSWQDRIRNYGALFADPQQEYRVRFTDPGGTLIQEIYSTDPGDTLIQLGPNPRLFDVSAALRAREGQTVNLLIEAESNFGDMNISIDDVSLLITAPGYATWTTYGVGCGMGAQASYYEQYLATSTSPFDLSGTTYSMLPTGTGYAVIPSSSPWFTPVNPDLGFSDDQTRRIALPWTFPHPGGTTDAVWLCSNGWLSYSRTTSDEHIESVSELLNGPQRLAVLWDDLDPSRGGTIHANHDTVTGLFHITFTNVPVLSGSETTTFQVTLHQSGIVDIKYGMMTNPPPTALVGYSPGNGANDPGPTDISALTILSLGDEAPRLLLDAAPGTRPVIGTPFNFEARGIPQSATAGAMLYGVFPTNPGLDLSSIGAPGCLLSLNIALDLPFAVSSPASLISLPIPNNPWLMGQHIYVQAAIIGVPNVRPLGIGTTNAGDIGFDIR